MAFHSGHVYFSSHCVVSSQRVFFLHLQEGYFGLSESKELGCTLYDCDPGASTEPLCHVDTGQCECRDHIGGRMCRQ